MFKTKILANLLPERTNITLTKELLEIVHTDLCGPLKTQSLGGEKYFMTFTDDFSRWRQIRFFKCKSDALEAFKDFKTGVENQVNKKIKFIQSDNGREYVSNEFTSGFSDANCIFWINLQRKEKWITQENQECSSVILKLLKDIEFGFLKEEKWKFQGMCTSSTNLCRLKVIITPWNHLSKKRWI